MEGTTRISAGHVWRLATVLAITGLVIGCGATPPVPSQPAAGGASPPASATTASEPAASASASEADASVSAEPSASEPGLSPSAASASTDASAASSAAPSGGAPAGETSPAASASAAASPGGSPSQPDTVQKFTADTIDGQPVLLLNLKVSFEWDLGSELVADTMRQANCSEPVPSPAATVSFYQDFEQGIESTAEYVYRYTKGRLSLGRVDIYSDGEAWDEADIRILANASYRATAYLGGVVDQPWDYTPPLPATAAPDAEPANLRFYPGAIYLGRLWNGLGSRCGPWSDDLGWRTIGHELAHYALFLHDQYYDVSNNDPVICDAGLRAELSAQPSPGASPQAAASAGADGQTEFATLMSYHYRSDALSEELDRECEFTPQRVVHGDTDVPAFERALTAYLNASQTGSGLALPSPLPAPVDVSLATQQLVITPQFSTPTTELHSFRVECQRSGNCGGPLNPAAAASGGSCITAGDGYVLKNVDPTGFPQRVIGEGYLIYNAPSGPGSQAGVNALVGLEQGDNVSIFTQDPSTGDFEVASAPQATASGDTIGNVQSQAVAWCPQITLDLVVDARTPITRAGDSAIRGFNVRVVNKRPNASITGLRIAYCPAGRACQEVPDGESVLRSLQAGDTATEYPFADDLTATLSLGEQSAAAHGYFLVRGLVEQGAPLDAVIWYQLGGGLGPATIDGHPPLVDGKVRVDLANQNTVRALPGDSRVIYSRFWTCEPLPDGAFELPIYVQVKVGNQSLGASQSATPVVVRLGYDADVLASYGVSREVVESQLRVDRLDAERREWRPLDGDAIDVDPLQNSVAVVVDDFNANGEAFVVSIAP